MTTLKRPGRPRLYADAAVKLSVFRERQAASGYLRKEILVTADTEAHLKCLALAHQVSVSDVASALLEAGLAAYIGGCVGVPCAARAAPAATVSVQGATRGTGGKLTFCNFSSTCLLLLIRL